MADRGTAIITGGSRGIGAATALHAARAGYRVAIVYAARADRAQEVVERIRAHGGTATAIRADIGVEADVLRAFEEARRTLGPLTGLVNNAAITGGQSLVADTTVAALESMLRTNVVGAFLCSREAVRAMSTRRGGSGGSIVNVSSNAARTGSPGVWTHYAMSKGALDTLTIGLAKEVAADGIRVCGVRPGVIDTEIHEARDPAIMARMVRNSPVGRFGTPEEIAEVIVWLLALESRYVTGSIVDACGGA